MSLPSDDAAGLIVARIGDFAAGRLQRAREGRVRAVFERSAYVELDGQWICIGGERLGCGPLNALVTSACAINRALATLVQDRPLRGTWPRFRTDHTLLDFTRAKRWHPTLPALPIERACVARGVARMQRAARARIPRDGLAFVVADVSGTGALAVPGVAAASALQTWLAGGLTPPDALRQVVGLGPGLTLPLCERATHPVSVAHLEAAAHGEGGEALHACLLALANDRDPDGALDAIAAVGHTSGWDALAGAMTVASAIVRD